MIDLIVIVLGLVMIAAAVLALLHTSLVTAILAAGAVSLVASVLYLLLAAPDVAMTEAAIGSALTTIVFLFALSRLRERGLASFGSPEDGEDEEAQRKEEIHG